MHVTLLQKDLIYMDLYIKGIELKIDQNQCTFIHTADKE
jgi:hypothetical protein